MAATYQNLGVLGFGFLNERLFTPLRRQVGFVLRHGVGILQRQLVGVWFPTPRVLPVYYAVANNAGRMRVIMFAGRVSSTPLEDEPTSLTKFDAPPVAPSVADASLGKAAISESNHNLCKHQIGAHCVEMALSPTDPSPDMATKEYKTDDDGRAGRLTPSLFVGSLRAFNTYRKLCKKGTSI